MKNNNKNKKFAINSKLKTENNNKFVREFS